MRLRDIFKLVFPCTFPGGTTRLYISKLFLIKHTRINSLQEAPKPKMDGSDRTSKMRKVVVPPGKEL